MHRLAERGRLVRELRQLAYNTRTSRPRSNHFTAGSPATSAFSKMNGSPLATVTVTFFNWMPFALRISKLFAAEIFTFSSTTLVMQLSGRPTMTPAPLGQVAVRLLMRMLRYVGIFSEIFVASSAAAGGVVSPEELFA